MNMTLELPLWAGETLIGHHADLDVEVMLDRHGELVRVIVPSFEAGQPPLRIMSGTEGGISGAIWRQVEEQIESGEYASEIAEYLAELRDAEREYARELRHEYAASSA